MDYGWIGFFLVAVGGAGVVIALTKALALPPRLVRLVWWGYLARLVGSVVRYDVLSSEYQGVGDASGYYNTGLVYADALWELDFSIFEPSRWWGQTLWGTQMMRYLSALALVVIGPSMRGEFLFFALVGLMGLVLIVQAVRAESEVAAARYAPYVLFLPSLCFWPCSVGKESALLLGLGLVTFGYAGRAGGGGLRTTSLLLGGALTFAIRPYLAGVAGLALCGAAVIRLDRSPARTAGLLLFSLGGVFVLTSAAEETDLDLLQQLEELDDYVTTAAAMTSRGGSQIEGIGGILGIPLGWVNVLFRPFPWEAHSSLSLYCALEVLAIWWAILGRRRTVAETVRGWRSRSVLRFGLLFGALLTTAYGMAFFNLGIIARQRTLVWPFLLLIMASAAEQPDSPSIESRTVGRLEAPDHGSQAVEETGAV